VSASTAPVHGGLEFSLTPAGDEHIRAFGDESLGGGQPNTAGASGDDGNLSCELFHRVLLKAGTGSGL
jgi:hypothetical protein